MTHFHRLLPFLLILQPILQSLFNDKVNTKKSFFRFTGCFASEYIEFEGKGGCDSRQRHCKLNKLIMKAINDFLNVCFCDLIDLFLRTYMLNYIEYIELI